MHDILRYLLVRKFLLAVCVCSAFFLTLVCFFSTCKLVSYSILSSFPTLFLLLIILICVQKEQHLVMKMSSQINATVSCNGTSIFCQQKWCRYQHWAAAICFPASKAVRGSFLQRHVATNVIYTLSSSCHSFGNVHVIWIHWYECTALIAYMNELYAVPRTSHYTHSHSHATTSCW